MSVWTHTHTDGIYRGVACLSIHRLTSTAARRGADVWVVINTADIAEWLRDQVGRGARIVLWTHHAANQPAIEKLADPIVRGAHDEYVFVSEWQREQYVSAFKIPSGRTTVLRNAIAPVFESLFSPNEPIVPAKSRPPTLAYTSTPFRGLNLLLQVFPLLRSQIPEVRLKIYSSMRVYQVSAEDDQAEHGWMYEASRGMSNVEYVGSLSQPRIAEQLKRVVVLAYTNIFPETSCIALWKQWPLDASWLPVI